MLHSRRPQKLLLTGMLLCASTIASLAAELPKREPTQEQTDFFEKRIRPILSANCFECHSANAKKIKGGLLLDSAEGLVKGGESGPVIAPGEPDKSLLIKAILYKDEDLQMPPKHQLESHEIADLEQWIRMGTPYP